MVRVNTEIKEYSFSSTSTPSYDLSLIASFEGLSYVISDKHQNLLVLKDYLFGPKMESLESFCDEVRETLLQDEMLKSLYNQIRVGLYSEAFTLVPFRLYNPSYQNSYLQQMVHLDKQMEIRSDALSGIQSYNVYALPKPVLDLFASYFPGAQYFHAPTAFLLGALKQAELQEGPKIFVNVFHRSLFIALFEGKELVFANFFNFRISKDFLYYLLLVFDQFKLKPESVPVYLSGKISLDSEVSKLLYRYIRHLNMTSFPLSYRRGQLSEDLKGYQYFDLLSLKLCE